MTATQQTFEVGDARVTVHRLGSGPTLGYLHGVTGNPVVHPFLHELANDHHVVAPSLPGFDDSEAPLARTLHDRLFHLSAMVDAVELAGAPVVASSVGAMLALELAALRPEAFSSLVLLAPLGLWDDAEPIHDVWAERAKAQPAVLFADPGRFAELTADPEGLSTDELTERELARYRTRRSAASLMWPIPDHGLRRRLHRVACPVHLVWGAADRLVPPSYAQRFADALPDCRGVTVVDGAGHALEWDAPSAVTDAVRAALPTLVPR